MAFSFVSTGRGNNTHAYTHSVGESHHVFLNLHTLRFYCLPDNYEIIGEFPRLGVVYEYRHADGQVQANSWNKEEGGRPRLLFYPEDWISIFLQNYVQHITSQKTVVF
jgi:hypothetical protein